MTYRPSDEPHLVHPQQPLTGHTRSLRPQHHSFGHLLLVYFCLLCLFPYSCLFVFLGVTFSFFGATPRDWLGRTFPKWPVLWQMGHFNSLTHYNLGTLPSRSAHRVLLAVDAVVLLHAVETINALTKWWNSISSMSWIPHCIILTKFIKWLKECRRRRTC